MNIQVTTDNHIHGSAELSANVESVVEATLSRFGDRITRVEVHLTDENSSVKRGDNDKRCVMEARLAGLQPIGVTNHAASISDAIDGAAEKLERALEHALGKLDKAKGNPSMGGEQGF